VFVQKPIAERIKVLRDEIVQIKEANSQYLKDGKKALGTSDQQRRLERLQAIMDELLALTAWKQL
jgi:hypothetical protein